MRRRGTERSAEAMKEGKKGRSRGESFEILDVFVTKRRLVSE